MDIEEIEKYRLALGEIRHKCCVSYMANSDELAKALAEIHEISKRFMPAKSPLDLPLVGRLSRFAGDREVELLAKRECNGADGSGPRVKLCRVHVDRGGCSATAYYDGRLIGRVEINNQNHAVLERAGVGILRAFLANVAHKVNGCKARKAAKAAEGSEA